MCAYCYGVFCLGHLGHSAHNCAHLPKPPPVPHPFPQRLDVDDIQKLHRLETFLRNGGVSA